MKEVVILIPPSEGKREGGINPPVKASREVLNRVRAIQRYKGDNAKLYGVKGRALEKALAINAQILGSKTLPAIARYSGVVYEALDYASLKPNAKRFAESKIRIVSAVFGLISPKELISDYKLKIDKLECAKFWKPIISKELKGKFVIDLLPKAHKKAVSYDEGVAVEFIVTRAGKSKPAGHAGKYVKGRFIRWLCEHQITRTEQFHKFREGGFVWTNGRFSTEE